ncbi:MAG TPA: SRPBCC family protein, partial [Burkholderiales bacterium]|nr:SRPBCC family protein [Burkholderiales bacterium]
MCNKAWRITLAPAVARYHRRPIEPLGTNKMGKLEKNRIDCAAQPRKERRRCCAWLLACLAAPAAAAEDFSIESSHQGGAVVLHVQVRIHARPAVIWGTLTDYDKLAQFVPGMTSSRVLERHGLTAVVEQKGAARVLFFSYPIEVTVESLESPPDRLMVRVLKGNLRQLEGGYHLSPVEGSEGDYLLSWRGVIEPDFDVPSLITVPLMRSTFKEQFLAMVKEIERREALA